MKSRQVGILHPGSMGIFVAACLQKNGHSVYWVSEGRSAATQRRAGQHNLQDAGSLAHLCQICDTIVSVCPPHAAETLAAEVLAHGFQGLYVDANAIAPQRATRIAQRAGKAGVAFVDGGIVGGPAWDGGETWLYLSGATAAAAADLLAHGPLVARQLGDEVGQASALKMCYAAYTKGTTALLCAILAAAENLGVRRALEAQWNADWPDFTQQSHRRVQNVTTKAWRFHGEMGEIASTFAAAGLPPGFHEAAQEIYARLAHFKGSSATPELLEVLQAAALP